MTRTRKTVTVIGTIGKVYDGSIVELIRIHYTDGHKAWGVGTNCGLALFANDLYEAVRYADSLATK
jgi:hypothetical protein